VERTPYRQAAPRQTALDRVAGLGPLRFWRSVGSVLLVTLLTAVVVTLLKRWGMPSSYLVWCLIGVAELVAHHRWSHPQRT
jgi:hypothetical protein